MNCFKSIAIAMALLCSTATSHAQSDSTENKLFEGNVYTEINYGRHEENSPQNLWDFPHVVAAGTFHLGKGWNVEMEFEYERFYENGEWGNNFDDNFTANKVYVSKSFNDKVGVKGGIIEVPIGIVNAGGPGLTIYDPESESHMLPMTWHEGGVGLFGTLGKVDYQLSGFVYTALPIHESEGLGGAIRLDYHLIDNLRFGVSSYWGKPCKSEAHRAELDYITKVSLLYAAFDFDYQQDGVIVDGSVVYNNDKNAHSVGIEAGYDILASTTNEKFSLIPFARFDGVYNQGDRSFNKITLGLNFSPISNLVLKAEYATTHHHQNIHTQSFDLGVSYSIDF